LSSDDRVVEIIAACRERLERGEAFDPDELLREHPDLAGELRGVFAVMTRLRPPVRKPGADAGREDGSPAGRTLGGYRLVREIGRGGQATVWLADDLRLPRRAALKVFAAGALSSPQALARFRREADAASRLSHPGICPVYEAGVDGETPYIAMRHLEGTTLAQCIEAAQADTTRGGHASRMELPASSASAQRIPALSRVFLLVEKAARALHVAHEAGLVHRDVKPANIMVTTDSEPVLLDFGFARDDDGHTLTVTGALVGTPAYMSPEQLAPQSSPLDRRTDVYSLGVTLYECLTLALPFEASTREALYCRILSGETRSARSLNREIPRDIEIVLAAAMEKDRERRYRTALDFADDLRRVREHEPIRARPVAAPVHLARWARRHPAVSTGAGAAFGALALALAITVHFLDESRDEQRQTADALRHARALGLASMSKNEMPTNGMRGLLLAREAVRLEPSPFAFAQLREAVFHSLERAVLRGHTTVVNRAAFSPAGDRIVTASRDGTARIWNLTGRQLAVLTGHGDAVQSAVFSPSGDRIVTASADRTARLWDLSGNELAVMVHQAGLASAEFSPDGKCIVTAAADGTAQVWGMDGSPLAALRGHTSLVNALSFSPKGDQILTASSDGTARIWDFTGTQQAVLKVKGGGTTYAAAFSAQGDRIVTGSGDGSVRVWSSAGEELAVLRGHEDGVTSVAFSPKGDMVVSSSEDHTARVWDPSGRVLQILRGHGDAVFSASFSPSGDRILTGSQDGLARLFDLSGKLLLRLAGHEGQLRSVSFSSRGDHVVTASSDFTGRVWDLAEGEIAALRGHEAPVTCARFCPDGERVLTGSEDGTARLWDVAGNELAVMRGHDRRVETVDVSPSDDLVLTGGRDGSARVWDFAGGAVAVLKGHRARISTARFSPKGDLVLTAAWDGWAILWDRSWNRVAELKSHAGYRTPAAAFSPRGDRVVTGSWDRTASVWDLAGKELAVLKGHRFPVACLAMSSDGGRIATGANDWSVRIWDLAGRQLATTTGHAALVNSVAFSPRGDLVLSASNDQTAQISDLTGRQVVLLHGHAGAINQACFSPDGDRVLTASADTTARIWNLAGKELAVFTGHAGPLTSAEFSPKGDRIVTSSQDGTARVWFVRDEDVLALADRRITREFSRGERERFADLLGQDNADIVQAYGAVDRLAEGTVIVSELNDRVRADPSLSVPARAFALKLVSRKRDDADAINAAAWPVVRSAGRSAAEHELAARRLEVAAALVPKSRAHVNSLGVAQYRCGAYSRALETLKRAQALKGSSTQDVIDFAFIAMCRHQLGQVEEARRCLVQLRDLCKKLDASQSERAAEFVAEADAVCAGD
jgi:WD40 repeat protein/tRNA A-37 threonylcarbamoyl transferase component Bud32